MVRDDRVAFGVEGHLTDRRPVSRGARPARWVALTGLDVKRVSSGQDGVILAAMALPRGDLADAAVAVLVVVPAHEFGCPGAGGFEVGEALGWELGAVLGGAEQRLGVGVSAIGVIRVSVPPTHLSART